MRVLYITEKTRKQLCRTHFSHRTIWNCLQRCFQANTCFQVNNNLYLNCFRYGNEIDCQNKNEALCATARGDCSTPIGRLMCPKRCGLCKESCVDNGQHCSIANCDEIESQIACPKTCGYVHENLSCERSISVNGNVLDSRILGQTRRSKLHGVRKKSVQTV